MKGSPGQKRVTNVPLEAQIEQMIARLTPDDEIRYWLACRQEDIDAAYNRLDQLHQEQP